MASSYSLDIRDRVVAFVDAGHSRRAAVRQFAVSDSFSIKLVRRVVETGSITPGRQGRPEGSGKLEPHAAFLAGIVEAQPDITMPELRDDKAMNRVAFDIWVDTQLAPTLTKGVIVILDNRAVHKSAKAAAVRRERAYSSGASGGDLELPVPR